MSNKTYNIIISLIGFLASLGFAVCKIIGILSASWWFILVPFVLVIAFHHSEEEDDDDTDDNSNNNLKMA